ncbi:DUF7351 domain-containing protein [Halobaculum sp. EA56]|uniref:winged helix-turn-helix domain-containing protein n=1 Tax=Halobaculum sp. EA56 TaxID=3421648 RepID=UPI003EBAA5C6
MAPGSNGGDRDALPPDDAFTLAGNGTRMAILRALWDAYEPYASDNAVPFSELFDRVDVEDTGNFNYHLGKLTGHFVRRTDAGYELSAPGFRIVRAVVAGGVTGNPALAPSRVGETCDRCGSPVAVAYEDGITWVRCRSCEGYWPQRGGEIFGFGLPPNGLRGRDPDGVLDATIAYSIRRFETMIDGVCPECGAPVAASLAVCDDHDPGEGVCDACGSRFLGVVSAVCDSCKFHWRSPGYAPVSHHPALISFYDDRGVEHVPATWAAIERGFGWVEERVPGAPDRLRLVVGHDGHERRFTLDRTATVVDVER